MCCLSIYKVLNTLPGADEHRINLEKFLVGKINIKLIWNKDIVFLKQLIK